MNRMERRASTVMIPKTLQIRLQLSGDEGQKCTELNQFNLKSIFSRSQYLADALNIAIGLDVKHICLLDC